MPTRQREKSMIDKSLTPAGWLMTLLTISRPAIGEVIRIDCTGKIGSVTGFTLSWRPPELTDSGTLVTAFTGGYRMGTGQGKTGACMFCNQPGR